MIRVKSEKELKDDRIVKTCDMKPLQIGIVVDEMYTDAIVMMSARGDEIINLSDAGEGKCWGDDSDLEVKLFPVGEKITLEIWNEE